jgi:uncharacterized membrane protein YesL
MALQQKERKWTKIFSWNRDGKGIFEEEDRTPNLKFFFKLLWRKLSQLISLNLILLIPVLLAGAAVWIYFSGPTTSFMDSIGYAPALGVDLIAGSPVSAVELGFHVQNSDLPVYLGTRLIPVLILALAVVLINGWFSVGASYVTRGMVRGEATFVYSDFFYAIRRNLKQGLLFGILDALIVGLLAFDFLFFYQRNVTYWQSVGFYAIVALLILYLLMRTYVYPMMITFDLSIRKLIKNAFIFATVGIKRNLMLILGVVILAVFHGVLLFFAIPYGLAMFLVIPFFYLFALLSFMGTYAVYPVIDRYMIRPYEDAAEAVDPDGDL